MTAGTLGVASTFRIAEFGLGAVDAAAATTAEIAAAAGRDLRIADLPRIGSVLKIDRARPVYDTAGRIVQEFPAQPLAHGFSDVVDNFAGDAARFEIGNGATLLQLEGSQNGVPGRFEWVVDQGFQTHRMFVEGGTINGVSITP
jgi:hypothetical protein